MDFSTYQEQAMRTDNSYQNPENRLLNGLMGLNGEAGEAIDILKKNLFQGHPLDRNKMVEELGDVLWYLALCADSMDIRLDEIAEYNIHKLMKRYPDGFSSEKSINRKASKSEAIPFSILRKMHGYEQQIDLVRAIGNMSPATISNWEKGKARIKYKTACKIATLFGDVTPYYVEKCVDFERTFREEQRNRKNQDGQSDLHELWCEP